MICVCLSVTHRWESDDRSLKAPSGISDMSLPCRDLRKGKKKRKKEKKGAKEIEKSLGIKSLTMDCLCNLFQVIYLLACAGTDTYNKRRDLSPSNALTGMHRRRL